MKKSLLALLIIPFMLAGCGSEPKVDPVPEEEPTPAPQPGKEDEPTPGPVNPDPQPKPTHECIDNNSDHLCDVCGNRLTACVDNDLDHNCDVCGIKITSCVDNNKDHLCDICGLVASECVDGNNDFVCDICERDMSKDLVGATVKKQPNKVRYYVDEVFDPAGMVINAQYRDGSYEPVTDYTYSQDKLKLTDTSIDVVYKQFILKIDISVIEKPIVEDEYTATIDFHSSTYASKFPEGTNFDNERKFEELLEYIDDQLEYYDLINTLTLVKGQSRKVNSVTYLQIGTGSGDGSLKWSCKEKIYSIQVKAMAYSKYNDYGKTWNVDREAHLNVAGTDYSLEVSTGEPTILTLDPVTFDQGITDFTISSSGGRVLISEMTITWRG